MKGKKLLVGIVRIMLMVAFGLWIDSVYDISGDALFFSVFVFYLAMLAVESLPITVRQLKLNNIGKAEGMYSDTYVEYMLKLMDKLEEVKKAPYYITLIALHVGRGEFEKAVNAINALPVDWPECFEYKLISKEAMSLRVALYFNNAIACYYHMRDLDKVDFYYNEGEKYIFEYLKNGNNKTVKSAIQETLASYHELHGEDDKAIQMLDELEYSNSLENFCSGTRLRAEIHMKSGNYEDAKALLNTIKGKNESPFMNQKVEKLLAKLQ